MAKGTFSLELLTQTRDGVPLDKVWADLQEGLRVYNEQSIAIADLLVRRTSEKTVAYPVGQMSFQRATQFAPPDRQRVGWASFDVPMAKYDLGLMFTWQFLKEATQTQIDAFHAEAMRADKDNVIKAMLQRALMMENETETSGGITYTYPGFCNGSGYTPPAYKGKTFSSSHNHYLRYAAASLDDGIKAMKDTLIEHGHDGNRILFISTSDESSVRACTNFIAAAQALIQPASTTAIAKVAGDYIGVIHGFQVQVCGWMPQYYYFGFNSYGVNSIQNPLIWRFMDEYGDGLLLVNEDPGAKYPLINSYYFRALGIGVQSRTNGVAMYIAASGNYVTPTL